MMKQTTHLDQALADGHIEIIMSGKTEKIRYVAVNHTEKWSDPEEKVRAAFYSELIYRYGYEPECIGVEITVPDRTSSDRADLVVFHDKERTRPFAVIECKRDGVSDTEMKQAIEQAFGNGHAHKFHANYVGVVAGQTRAFFDCSDAYGVLEREANVIADLPVRYGKPEEFKFYKNCPRNPTSPPFPESSLSAPSANATKPSGAEAAFPHPPPSVNSANLSLSKPGTRRWTVKSASPTHSRSRPTSPPTASANAFAPFTMRSGNVSRMSSPRRSRSMT